MEPPNDNRTEQWLQAYARRRRERAGEAESMHEATRRMLLDEAKREWGAKGEAAEAKEPAQEESPWARWAWAGTVMAAVLVIFVVSRPDGAQAPDAGGVMEMAQNDPATPADDEQAGPTQGTGAAAEKIEPLQLSSVNKDKNRDLKAVRRGAGSPSPQTIAPSQPEAAASPLSTAPQAFNAAPANVMKRTKMTARSSNFYAGEKNLRQDFARQQDQAERTRNAPPVPEAKAADLVLRNFKFERNGNVVKVVDQDGSVYLGQAQLAPVKALSASQLDDAKKKEGGQASPQLGKTNARPTTSNVAATQAKAPGREARSFFFSVTGTNQTLRQRVVFEGNFANEQLKATEQAVDPARPAKPPAAVQQAAPALQLRIQGRARVGRLSYGIDARNQLGPAPKKAGASPGIRKK